ncbi:hypothetical protein GT025_19910 [Streptomyces sp. SID4920]|nr:hypothetical protein [Streptomyces sp. SID4920]MYX64172.1 hypothetical protein [Streptomyces sp. SID8373]
MSATGWHSLAVPFIRFRAVRDCCTVAPHAAAHPNGKWVRHVVAQLDSIESTFGLIASAPAAVHRGGRSPLSRKRIARPLDEGRLAGGRPCLSLGRQANIWT